MALEIYNLQFH